jgi:hypothetical protein
MPTPHPYGPHQPEHAPNAVTILTGGTWHSQPIRTEVRPLPRELVRQREFRDELAHRQGKGEGVMHHCPAKGREVWTPADWCPLCRTRVVASDG